MSQGYRRDPSRAGLSAASEMQELVACLLNRFNIVSVSRIHKLAFLLEGSYKAASGDRITNATYFRVMDGCRSDDITGALEELEDVEVKEVSISGEKIRAVKRTADVDCGVKVDDREKFDQCLDHLVSEFGEAKPEVVNEALKMNPSYQKTHLGEPIPL